MFADRHARLGLLVNPIAGMGGSVGLKGTDGAGLVEEARRRGARPIAEARAVRALRRMRLLGCAAAIFAGRGPLGEAAAHEAGIEARPIGPAAREPTCGEGTRACAERMLAAGVDLILFAGGDGTARDVHAAVGDRVPILGIPTGVKMHSAVFATTPENAGEAACRVLASGGAPATTRDAEVMDCDETELRRGRIGARLFGFARTPDVPLLIQRAKAGAPLGGAALDACCRRIACSLDPGVIHVIGPGTSTKRILAALGLTGTLTGVDAICDGRLVGTDLDEAAILRLIEGRAAHIIVGVIGGQGFVFGRGNQQTGPEVIRRVGRENITVVASLEKLVALEGRPLLVDTGDLELDAQLAGFMRVHVAPDRSVVCRVSC